MKNCDEMVNSLLGRREQYAAEQIRKRKVVTRTVIPMCCICLVALVGIGIWKGSTIGSTPSSPQKDGSQYVSNDNGNTNSNNSQSSSNASINTIGKVEVNGVTYVQLSTTTKTYTPNTCLGDASDFEGTYQISDVSAKLYTTKEDPDILIVKLENGDYLILAKEKINS